MSEKQSQDILQPVPLEQWSILQEKTKLKWPLYAYLYYWVQNAIRWKKQNPNFPVQLYSPTGDSSSNTFIGISQSALFIVIVFTLEEECETLKNIVKETKYIDWSQGTYFAGTHKSFLPSLLSVIHELKAIKNIDYYPLTPGNYYFKSAEESAIVDFDIPSECYLKMLDKSHIPGIHSVWPHKDLDCPDLSTMYLTTMVEMNGGVGLFLKEDNTLVSWALHTDWDGMGMVQTMEGHTRKGYAKVVINALAKKLGKEGTSTTLFIVEGNTPSENLFESLGFKRISLISWVVIMRPNGKPTSAKLE